MVCMDDKALGHIVDSAELLLALRKAREEGRSVTLTAEQVVTLCTLLRTLAEPIVEMDLAKRRRAT